MSAHTIFALSSPGLTAGRVRRNGIPKVPAWKNGNSQGRLIRKQGRRDAGTLGSSGSFTPHEADFGAGGVIAIRVHLAPHRAVAQHWLSQHGYPNAVLEDVTADVAAADAVEGRTVA